MARQRDRFLADAFHEAAIAGDYPGPVVDEIITEACIQMPLRHRHAHGCCNPLPERPGRSFDAGRDEVLRMARRVRAQLAEIADIVAADRGITGQVQQRVDQHRAVTGRKHEPVAVRPSGVARIVFQEFPEQHGRGIRHAQRQTDMA